MDNKPQHPATLAVILARQSGATLGKIARELGVSVALVHDVCERSCCTADYVRTISEKSKIRECLCCRHPILSQHAGHRLCGECRLESEVVAC